MTQTIYYPIITDLGTFAITDSYTVDIKYRPNDGFDSKQMSTMWNLNEVGNVNGVSHSCSISYNKIGLYPTLAFSTGNDTMLVDLTGVGEKNYAYLRREGVFFRLRCVYDHTNNQKRVYFDDYLIDSKNVSCPSINKSCKLTCNPVGTLDYRLYAGEMKDGTLILSAVSPTLTPPIGGAYRDDEFPLGFDTITGIATGTPTALDQLNTYRTPVIGATNPVSCCYNIMYCAGSQGFASQQVVNDSVVMQTVLTNKYKHVINIAPNLQALYDTLDDPNGLILKLIGLAQTLPKAKIAITTAWEFLTSTGGYIVYGGNKTATTPLNLLDGDRDSMKVQLSRLKSKMGNLKVYIIFENGEHLTDSSYLDSGTQAYVNQMKHVIYDNLAAFFPESIRHEYDVFHNKVATFNNVLQFDIRVQVNSDGRESGNIYLTNPDIWREHDGNIRGEGFAGQCAFYTNLVNRYTSIRFSSGGWNIDPRKNLVFAQLLGKQKIEYILGSTDIYSAYFTIGSSGIQDPRLYIGNIVATSYALEAVSTDWDIISLGKTLKGNVMTNWYNNGIDVNWEYNFITSDKQIFCVAREYNGRLLIGLHYNRCNNQNRQSRKKMCRFTIIGATNPIHNKSYELEARLCGSVYHVSADGTITQRDAIHTNKHPSRS